MKAATSVPSFLITVMLIVQLRGDLSPLYPQAISDLKEAIVKGLGFQAEDFKISGLDFKDALTDIVDNLNDQKIGDLGKKDLYVRPEISPLSNKSFRARLQKICCKNRRNNSPACVPTVRGPEISPVAAVYRPEKRGDQMEVSESPQQSPELISPLMPSVGFWKSFDNGFILNTPRNPNASISDEANAGSAQPPEVSESPDKSPELYGHQDRISICKRQKEKWLKRLGLALTSHNYGKP
ncbi:hypothetical protein U1Q18_014114 [Sarracenia purpurea var. burkii]